MWDICAQFDFLRKLSTACIHPFHTRLGAGSEGPLRTTNEKKKEKRKRDTVSGGAVDFVSFFFLSVLKSSISPELSIFIKSPFRLEHTTSLVRLVRPASSSHSSSCSWLLFRRRGVQNSSMLPHAHFQHTPLFACGNIYPRTVRNSPLRCESAAKTTSSVPSSKNAPSEQSS